MELTFNIMHSPSCTQSPKKAHKTRGYIAYQRGGTKYKDYTLADLRRGLCGLIEGKSLRRCADLTGVPRNTLARHFKKLVCRTANEKNPLNKMQQQKYLELVGKYQPITGSGNRYFTRDEELLFVTALQEAHDAAFPYDRTCLQIITSNVGKKIYDNNFSVGLKWIRKFEKRWSKELTLMKSSSIGRGRGEKAREDVRDKVFEKFVAYLGKLKQEGLMTEQQVRNLGDHLMNADEVGGDELGKRCKVCMSV